MDSDAITEKVKKLLRLAACKAAAPAEAALALNRAMELIDRHHIDVASLNLDEQTERIVCERINCGRRVSFIKRQVANILTGYFNVRAIWDENIYRDTELAVVGFEQDVAMAGYVFHFLVGACSRSVTAWAKAEKKARRRVTEAKRRNYTTGWFYGLAANLRLPDLASETLDDSKTAVVLAERQRKIEVEFDRMFPRRQKLKLEDKRKNWRVISAGYKDGKATSIHQPLSQGQQGTLRLT